jgi:hypothetical protein
MLVISTVAPSCRSRHFLPCCYYQYSPLMLLFCYVLPGARRLMPARSALLTKRRIHDFAESLHPLDESTNVSIATGHLTTSQSTTVMICTTFDVLSPIAVAFRRSLRTVRVSAQHRHLVRIAA